MAYGKKFMKLDAILALVWGKKEKALGLKNTVV